MFGLRKTKEDIINEKYAKRSLYHCRTFAAKLFIKLAASAIDPSIVTLQILQYEKENRNQKDIEQAIPWLKTLDDFMEFVVLNETIESSHKLLVEITRVLFYRFYHKNCVIKNAAENPEFFYLVLNGKIIECDLVFVKINLTLEQYLIYYIKMKLLNEREIMRKCYILNKNKVDINENNLEEFFINNPQFDYKTLKIKALNELIKLDYDIFKYQTQKKKYVPSVQSYIKSFSTNKRNIHLTDSTKANLNFYIGKQEIKGTIKKGQFIGTLSYENLQQNVTYICCEDCDIAYINKNKTMMTKINTLMKIKKLKIFYEIINNFYIFNCIKRYGNINSLNDISSKIIYNKYYKGDIIFTQGSIYKGIFLIKSGNIKINIKSSINEMNYLTANLKSVLKTFKEYISSLKDTINEQDDNFNQQKDMSIQEMEEIKNYEIMDIYENNIFGTNELFDYQTGIYNFSAICNSDSAVIYFLSKEHVNELVGKDKEIYFDFAQLIEFRVKEVIWRLKNYIKIFNILHKKQKTSFLLNPFIRNNNKITVTEDDEMRCTKTFSLSNNIYNYYNNLNNNKKFVIKQTSKSNEIGHLISYSNNLEIKKIKLVNLKRKNKIFYSDKLREIGKSKLNKIGNNFNNKTLYNNIPYCFSKTTKTNDIQKLNSFNVNYERKLTEIKTQKKRKVFLSTLTKNFKKNNNISYIKTNNL